MPKLCETFIAMMVCALGMLVLGAVQGPATAQSSTKAPSTQSGPKAVLELFTSQGCSSCPPADALLHTYALRNDIVALTLPVDYWDYLGWKDTLASPKFSARQRAYAKHRGDGRIYTPQTVINGEFHALGSSAREIDAAIDALAPLFSKSRIPLQIRLENGQLVIEAGAADDGPSHKTANIWLAVVQRQAEVPIKTGENHGKTLKYVNVVRELRAIGMWNGQPMQIRFDRDTVALPGADACAVLLQSGKAGPLIGAALLTKM